MFSSIKEVSDAIASAGYISDVVTATTVFLAGKLHKPILLEGPPGSGKTELAYAVASATGAEVERLQCYEGIGEEKAIGHFDESLQRLAVEICSKSCLVEWDGLKHQLHGEAFFCAGPLLQALRKAKSCVLLIDELDKVDQAFEAQAFKRACSCFGLGRYLYYFSGIWMDLDDKRRPVTKPVLTGWATAEGWMQGLRPESVTSEQMRDSERQTCSNESKPQQNTNTCSIGRANLIHQIETMAKPLGKGLYRGLLKSVARVWSPGEVHDTELLGTLLAYMQAADRGLRRLEAALERTGREPLDMILRSLNLKSLDRVDSLETLHKIVTALEEQTVAQS